ncbi:MAG: hypothetical protein KKE24_04585 [Candidatus Thermoplasmatota archaeon]|nr:hypothetical protein [Candidatus Thermoplasmatota archaeon]
MNIRIVPGMAIVLCLVVAMYYFLIEKHPWAGVVCVGVIVILLAPSHIGIAKTWEQQILMVIIGVVIVFLGACLDQGIQHYWLGDDEPPQYPFPDR